MGSYFLPGSDFALEARFPPGLQLSPESCFWKSPSGRLSTPGCCQVNPRHSRTDYRPRSTPQKICAAELSMQFLYSPTFFYLPMPCVMIPRFPFFRHCYANNAPLSKDVCAQGISAQSESSINSGTNKRHVTKVAFKTFFPQFMP